MMTFITQGGEGRGEKIRRGKLRKAKAEALKRGLVARSCARSGRKDVVGEVKGIEMMGVLIAGRGARGAKMYRGRRGCGWVAWTRTAELLAALRKGCECKEAQGTRKRGTNRNVARTSIGRRQGGRRRRCNESRWRREQSQSASRVRGRNLAGSCAFTSRVATPVPAGRAHCRRAVRAESFQ